MPSAASTQPRTTIVQLEVAWMNAQSQSAAYQEWLGSDNDIYDEVFANVIPACSRLHAL